MWVNAALNFRVNKLSGLIGLCFFENNRLKTNWIWRQRRSVPIQRLCRQETRVFIEWNFQASRSVRIFIVEEGGKLKRGQLLRARLFLFGPSVCALQQLAARSNIAGSQPISFFDWNQTEFSRSIQPLPIWCVSQRCNSHFFCVNWLLLSDWLHKILASVMLKFALLAF